MTDAYKVPDLAPGAFHRAEETVRRSRFIVTMARVSSPEEAKAFIDRIREEHAGATHNCWAYNAGAPGDTAQVGASDDGEPRVRRDVPCSPHSCTVTWVRWRPS